MNRNTKNNNATGEYGRVVKYLGLLGGAQGFSLLMNLLRNKISSGLLGTVGFGLIGLYNRTVQMFSDFTNMSLSLSAVRKLSDTYENATSAEMLHFVKVTRSIALLTGIIGMLLFLMFSPLVIKLFAEGGEYSQWYFIALSPTLLFMAVSGGEVAVLRGARRLNSLAVYTLWTSFVALVVALPMYYLWGVDGILPSILVIALLQMIGVLYHTVRLYAYKVAPFSMRLLRDGIDMLKLGAGYIYTTILVSFSTWLVYSAIFRIGGDSELGLFSSGYLLLSMLPSVLFAALDSEYYPRLSGAFGNINVRNAMVNEQIEVHSLIQTPIILSVVFLLPFIFPILYSNEYVPAVAMTQAAMFGLLFHVLTYPISFMALSKGDVVVFILQESVYNIANVVFIIGGYYHFGLKGVGFAILLVRIVDFVVVFSITYLRYGFRLSQCSRKYLFMNMFCALILFSSVFLLNGVVAWIFSSLSVLLSIILSVYFLAHHGDIFNKILKRLKLKR
ncbi:MAG: oligosaccharide flippase family protein [Bacteroidaceae bacterium]|nr:oligosaccharide flippase family protein [Bacteroidaceae bacterium]